MPEWATGAEWAGWRWNPRTQSMMRWSRGSIYEVTDAAELVVGRFYDDWQTPSTIEGLPYETARKAADLFAEADGGWRDGSEDDDE